MKIFVIASTRDEIDKKYIKEAEKLIRFIEINDYEIICCADKRGIIGKFYEKMEGTNRVILTLPKIYKEYANDIKEKIIYTNTINERTDISIKMADIIMCFPGGIGSIYELFSVLETKRAGEHNKKVIILNYFGIYDKILEQLDKLYKEKYIDDTNNLYYVAIDSESAKEYLKSCENK